jgi:hypothetical protein
VSERAPYSRVYWSVNSDPKFAGIYSDDAAFSLWVRLLLTADALWPAAAPLPRTARNKPLTKLVEAGLVDPLADDMYRIHGLDAERGRRAAAAKRDPAATQAGPKRDPVGSLAKPSLAETSTSQGLAEARDPADIYWQLTGRFPVEKALTWIDQLSEQYGSEAVIEALVAAHLEDRSIQDLIGRAKNTLAKKARALDVKEREAEKQRLREKRAVPRVEEPWRAEFRAILEQQSKEAAA